VKDRAAQKGTDLCYDLSSICNALSDAAHQAVLFDKVYTLWQLALL
jgi:hypothetical protein